MRRVVCAAPAIFIHAGLRVRAEIEKRRWGRAKKQWSANRPVDAKQEITKNNISGPF